MSTVQPARAQIETMLRGFDAGDEDPNSLLPPEVANMVSVAVELSEEVKTPVDQAYVQIGGLSLLSSKNLPNIITDMRCALSDLTRAVAQTGEPMPFRKSPNHGE